MTTLNSTYHLGDSVYMRYQGDTSGNRGKVIGISEIENGGAVEYTVATPVHTYYGLNEEQLSSYDPRSVAVNDELQDALHQIAWANFDRDDCGPPHRVRTPTREQVTAGYAKLRGNLTWGCKLAVYWQMDIDACKEVWSKDWKEYVNPDVGYLIALPGHQDELYDGVFWAPSIHEEKDNGAPIWMVLNVLLANPLVAWVEVVK